MIVKVLFIAFFAVGILMPIIWQRLFGVKTEIVSPEVLNGLAGMQWDYRAVFFKCLWNRASIFILLPILMLIEIGTWVLRVYLSWFAFTMGVLMETFVLQYGFMGMLLFLAGIFPQYIFYVLAYYGLYRICLRIQNRKNPIEYNSAHMKGRKKNNWFVQILMLLGVVITGCAFESYVNPFILKFFLKIFFV